MTDELDDFLCLDLHVASRAVTAAYRPILGGLGVTYPQYLVLAVLWERDERRIKELATALRLDHATLTPLLRRLEAAGLLTRRRSEDDERAVVVALTAEGRALSEHADDVRCRIAEAVGLPAEDVEVLRSLLRRVSAAVGAGPVPASADGASMGA
ncbi:MarR family winged helix-turn-helix transcriptional regulator [Nocardioides dongxiaopingii]|uniref:MarR family winged helix-turn-helix transcriptional regulator n=1 Tax=Nocardioides dongxiaopingii TaxID=2576036 RepID=UPI0010C767B3|nr:MarR family transcriptional regulator [Nocardioides dongxiaopingii]